MKKILVAALMLALPIPAFAAIQDVKVSGSVTNYFVDRSDFDFKTPSDLNAYNQNFFYTSTHVLISSDLSDNVSAQVGLANEVAWGDQNVEDSSRGGAAASNASDQQVDLELANITLREFLYSPLTVTVGRQSLSYGNDFLIGAAGGPSVGTMDNIATDMSRTQNYDGIRAVLDYKPLTIDLVYVKTNSNCLSGGTHGSVAPCTDVGNDDQNLYGGVANYQLNDPMSSVIEGSFWARTDDSVNTTWHGAQASTLYVPDLRVSTNPIKDLTLSAEGATQMGIYDNSTNLNEKRSKVFGLQGKATYTIPVFEKYKPTLAGTYTYVSGDNPKSTTKDNAWDPMFNDQNLGTRIWRSMFNYTNLQIIEASASISPLEDVTAKVTWTDLWLADTTPGVQSITMPDLSVSSETFTDKKDLGNEVDGEFSYQYTEDVSFGLNLGVFVPGDALVSHNNAVAKEAIVSMGVNF